MIFCLAFYLAVRLAFYLTFSLALAVISGSGGAHSDDISATGVVFVGLKRSSTIVQHVCHKVWWNWSYLHQLS
jgi:hypothetical protein